MADNVVLFALPVFLILMAAEWLYGHLRGRPTYRFADTMSSLGQGVLSQCVACCTQLFQIGLYSLVFHALGSRSAASSRWWASPWGWVGAILLFDFCDYWLHRAGHEINVLWAAHVPHHQSQAFNLSTALRQESLVGLAGWVFYLPMALIGVPPLQFAVAGWVVLLYQFWIHTEHIGKLGWFDRVFSSPSNHRVHHAINPRYINRNYGGMLVIWDRLFGTFEEESEPCVYGTQAPLASCDPLKAVFHVYAALARDAIHTRRWRDRLRLWFMPTGWRPADLPQPADPALFSPAAVPHYDPPVNRAGKVAAVFALLCSLGLTGGLLVAFETMSALAAEVLAASIAGVLWCLGALLERRMSLPAALTAVITVTAGEGWWWLAR